jgi:hypothetical protein
MAQPKWLEKYMRMKPEVNQIFEDLDKFREFCVQFGHSFDERDLYNERSYTYQDFMRQKEGKYIKNRWFARDDDKKFHYNRERPTGGYKGNNFKPGFNRNA